MNDTKQFPVWFTALTSLFFISNLFVFGLATFLFPLFTFPDAGEAAAFPIQFFSIRHIAFAFPLLYGLVRKDTKILTVMYSIFAIMSVLDVVVLGAFDYYIPALVNIPAVANLPAFGGVMRSRLSFLFGSAPFWQSKNATSIHLFFTA